MEIEQVLGLPAEDCIYCSAKTGQGITELLDAICARLPPPREPVTDKTRALIFDSHYDDYRGVIVYFRVFDGSLQGRRQDPHDGHRPHLHDHRAGPVHAAPGEGRAARTTPRSATWSPRSRRSTTCASATRSRSTPDPAAEALPGYKEPQQMVFCDFYPATVLGRGRPEGRLRGAARGRSRSCTSTTPASPSRPQHSEALGFGFRCGFLGLLHMEIVQERLEREGDVEIVQTAPTVTYEVRPDRRHGDRDPQSRRPARPVADRGDPRADRASSRSSARTRTSATS